MFVDSVDEALDKVVKYPVVVEGLFTLTGSFDSSPNNVAINSDELRRLVVRALEISPIGRVVIDDVEEA